MNIFYLHSNPVTAAHYQHDKHVVKMCLETAQILCTVAHSVGVPAPYKATHARHPSVLWAAAAQDNFAWLVLHGLALCTEYTYRYGKTHACQQIIADLRPVVDRLPAVPFTPPTQAMPPEFQCSHDTVQAYRTYYLERKVNQSGWTGRSPPAFVLEYEMATKKSKPAAKASVAKAPKVKATKVAKAAIQKAATTSADVISAAKRGPKGVPLTAMVNVVVQHNPKRVNTAAYNRFAMYENAELGYLLEIGITTADLVYDAAHGYITIEGYTPTLVVKNERVAKPKAEPKAKRGKKPAAEAAVEEQGELELATQEETIE